jgi:flagellar protein FliS
VEHPDFIGDNCEEYKMSIYNPYKQYRQTQIGTADKTKLVILVYDGAITYLRRAKQKLDEKNFEEKGDFLFKAQDILLELMGALDMNMGEVAQSLYNLYHYMMKRLTEANIKNDPEMIGEVITLLSGLRQTWAEAILMMNGEHAA